MWGVSSQLGLNIKQTLPSITLTNVLYIALSLLALRAGIQKVLVYHFQINQSRPQHSINSLEYSYFYHLSIIILILSEVDWNMFDLAIWVLSYVGVGYIRKAIHVIRIEREIMLNDYSYNRKIMLILSASKIFGLILFVLSIAYFLISQHLFEGVSIKLSSLMLFPTIMLAVDSLFLLLSSQASQQNILSYFNPNINSIQPTYKIDLTENIVGNSLRVWHYYNILRLFIKAVFQKVGVFNCLWILSVINAAFMSAKILYQSISKYRSFSALMKKFNKIFQPTSTAPDQNCVICMTELLNCRRLSACGHLFHYKCLFQWIQTKTDCPICRTPIRLTDE